MSRIAESKDIALPTASVYLRALNARGLLRAERVGREVHYSAKPDRAVPEASRILRNVIRILDSGRRDPIHEVYYLATGFTHPRRIQIVRALRGQSLTRRELQAATGIARPPLVRHLKKLLEREFVIEIDGRYQCRRQPLPLSQTFLSLAYDS